jgi:hypothetical protein
VRISRLVGELKEETALHKQREKNHVRRIELKLFPL